MRLGGSLTLPAVWLLLSTPGCGPSGASGTAANPASAGAAQHREVGERLFQSAVDMLNHLGDYDETHVEAAVSQVVRRLNESFAAISPGIEKSDPFLPGDGKIFREVVWLRDAARFAVGDETDPLRRAEQLFDWTVRNIQRIPADAKDELLPFLPWHIQLFGIGSSLDRAWLFTLLARQELLDVVLLAEAGDNAQSPPTEVWPALVLDGKLHVFDTTRAVSVERDVSKMIAYIEASSFYQASRFARLESKLTGDDKLILSIDVADLADRAKKCGVAEVRPWKLWDERYAASRAPAAYERLTQLMLPLQFGRTVRTPPLWVARVRHITGNYDYGSSTGRPTIARLYQEARPSEEELAPLQRDSQTWFEAHRMKQDATYWLGLVSYDLQNYETAVRYFELVLGEKANGGWTRGARYNLGRTYEAWQKPAEAKKTYEGTYLGVPPDAQCLERAKRLSTTSTEQAK